MIYSLNLQLNWHLNRQSPWISKKLSSSAWCQTGLPPWSVSFPFRRTILLFLLLCKIIFPCPVGALPFVNDLTLLETISLLKLPFFLKTYCTWHGITCVTWPYPLTSTSYKKHFKFQCKTSKHKKSVVPAMARQHNKVMVKQSIILLSWLEHTFSQYFQQITHYVVY